MSRIELAKHIDHTLLKATATAEDITTLCAEAAEHGFATVCVNPCRVALAAGLLAGKNPAVCAVVGFPLGATSAAAKLAELEKCLDDGAAEIDMVVNIGLIKDGEWEAVEGEIRLLADAAHRRLATLKVILETCLLERDEIAEACRRSAAAAADFVKTSTGFGGGGATVEDIKLMSETVAGRCSVKASGGVKSRADAEAMLAAGASRIGTSAGVDIVAGRTADNDY